MKRHWLAPLVISLLLLGCHDDGNERRDIQTAWHKKDLDAHLTRWLAVGTTPSGLLIGQFDRNWKAASQTNGDLTLHSRLVYSLIAGYEFTGDQRYRAAAQRGTDFLLTHFRDHEYGGFYARVDASGKVIASNKNTYGHACALLALSHMARITGEVRYRQAALTAWGEIKRHLRDDFGGFRTDAPRDFSPSSGMRTQNPLMHMFEAQLALIDATGDAEVLADTAQLGNFVLNKLMVGLPTGGAYIPEWYDAQWRPIEERSKGGYVDLGHQFEWSHLLRTAEQRGLPPLYSDVAERILQYAIATGYDEIDGGVFHRAYSDGRVDRHKYWWQQAEGMRAFMTVGQRPEMARRYHQTLELVDTELLDRENGGWRLGAKRTCDAGLCRGGQPEPYHLVGMDVAALALVMPKTKRPP